MERVSTLTDKYFSKTRQIVEKYGDVNVKYGVFLRRSVVVAIQPAIDLITAHSPDIKVTRHFEEGAIVVPNKKLLTIEGPFTKIVELETVFLQKIGFACVSAYNAYQMCSTLKSIPFIAMDGRHCTGEDMMKAAAYGASVGSRTAKMQGAVGFVGTSNDLCAPFFNTPNGIGTMPHALIGYAAALLQKEWIENKGNPNSYSQLYVTPDAYAKARATSKATEMYLDTTGEKSATALVDYYGHEVADSIATADLLFNVQKRDVSLSVRIDTHGGRFCQGLDYAKSVDTVAHWLRMDGADEFEVVRAVIGADVADAAGDEYMDKVRKVLFAQGVSAANIIHMRSELNKAEFPQVKIVASSGFDLFKCKIFAQVNAPVNVVGTGSYMPKTMSETYSTADIYMYDDVKSVKVGREFLFD